MLGPNGDNSSPVEIPSFPQNSCRALRVWCWPPTEDIPRAGCCLIAIHKTHWITNPLSGSLRKGMASHWLDGWAQRSDTHPQTSLTMAVTREELLNVLRCWGCHSQMYLGVAPAEDGLPDAPFAISLSIEECQAVFPSPWVCLGILRSPVLFLSGERLSGTPCCGSKWGFSDISHCGFDWGESSRYLRWWLCLVGEAYMTFSGPCPTPSGWSYPTALSLSSFTPSTIPTNLPHNLLILMF